MPTIHQPKAVWAHDFDNSKRHCFFNTITRGYSTQGYPQKDCATWRDHIKSTGRTEWLRFIHAFGDQVDRNANPFLGDDEGQPRTRTIFFESDGHTTSDGRLTYSETYLVLGPKGTEAAFRVFISNDDADRWARIECYRPDLFEACDMAWMAVQTGYADQLEDVA